jgi:3-deoxy-7-phosphoheptulonate synthase
VGADGLIIEVHHQPEQALSDGYQSILPEDFVHPMNEIRQIAALLERSVP